ncbi:hypothetical protein Tsubulata_048834 [Turnera subulata]|uniref:Uncharacterized protein n=1 Tax=Turnera subulata TaxID=218843 RepID=A0A9Q0J3M2_9ROSI|nr:hypothetical protein Tsubulata_048834 [Turnera subulata]
MNVLLKIGMTNLNRLNSTSSAMVEQLSFYFWNCSLRC